MVGFLALAVVAFVSATAVVAADEVTITGTVTEEGIMTDEGELYGLADNDQGQELMELADKKVEVKGTVEESEGKKVITVTSYEVLE